MFGSIKSFFTDIVAPIGITIAAGGNPLPAAAYMGIKTGIETGSPLAGIGSAAFSYGIGSLTRGLTAKPTGGEGIFGLTGTGMSDVGQNIIADSTAQAVGGGGFNFAGQGVPAILQPGGGAFAPAFTSLGLPAGGAGAQLTGEAISGGSGLTLSNVDKLAGLSGDPYLAARTLASAPPTPPPTSLLGGFAKDIGISFDPVPIDPTGLITDKTVNPAYIAAGGLGLQMAATPPEAPAPLTLPPTEERDFSKYDYKGPLDRGEYTYPDPEDLAYGRTSPDSYGYIGAKKGGQIKKFQMGGFSPTDPRMKPVDSRVTSQNVNIMSPPGGIADPTPSANFLATGKIDTVPPGISQLLKAGKPKTKAPKGSPLQTMKMAEKAMMPQMPIPQMPQQAKGINFDQVAQNLPRKDLDIDINQIRGFLGLAEGGNVPGMAEQPPAGSTGPSSTVDMSAVNYGKSEPGLRQRFDDEIIGIYENMLSRKGRLLGPIGRLMGQTLIDQQGDAMFKYAQDNNLLRGIGGSYQGPLQRSPYRYPSSAENLAMGKEDVSKIGYESVTYPGVKKMKVDYYNQGGEVESNKTLQENAFVIPADVVGHLGDGSSDAGAQKLQSFFGMNPQQYQAGGIMAGELQGPGGGMDDLIQTSIEGKQAAAVSPQEFVVPRDVVAKLGKGSYDQGSKKLYSLMKNVRKIKTGTTKQPNELTLGLNQLMSA
jgi:hypothetical protein